MPEEKTPKKPAADDDFDDLFNDTDSKGADAPPATPKPESTAKPKVDDEDDDLAAEPADDMPAAADDKESAKPAGDDFDDMFEDDSKESPKSAAAEPAADDMTEPADQPVADDESMPEEESAQVAPEIPVIATEPIAPSEDVAAPEATVPADSLVVDPLQAEPAEAEMRLWTDNTGTYTVRARLVSVLDGKVRLQKETGRFTTVPFERLSKPDLAFVQGLVPAIASNTVDRGAEF
jgi:hypothetical protein